MDTEQATLIPIQLHYTIISIERHMYLLCVHPGHDVRRILADLDFLQEFAAMTIEHVEARSMPLRLVNLLLIMACPHVVAVVHLLIRKRDLPLHLPTLSRYHAHRSREVLSFPLSQFILGIDPDFSNTLDAGFLWRGDDVTIKRGLQSRS